MPATEALIKLLGETALLLWGVRTIGESLRRAFGSNLRRWLTLGLRDRRRAFAAGLLVTALLQSSTATAFMIASLSGLASIELAPALAVMLGANVGTTLIVQALSFDTQLVSPLLIITGVAGAGLARRATMREAFVALLGLGLMLLSLHLMRETLKPLEESQTLRLLLGSLTRDTIMNMGLAALFAWIAHSSVAAVLFVMSLAGSQLIGPQAAMAMVLGANLGAAINPLTAAGADRGKRRIAAGNLAMRLAGCVMVAPLLPGLAPLFSQSSASPARLAADFHLAFNLALALVFIGWLPALARLLDRLSPDAPAPQDEGAPRYLDRAALASPAVALSNAARETLRMSDIVDQMLRGAREAFARDDRERVRTIRSMDDHIDQLYRAIQLYVGEIDQRALTREESGRIAQIVALTINLEHVGDIIDSNLMQIAGDRIENNLALTSADLRLVGEMHDRLIADLQLAMAVFMQGDAQAARRLIEQKEQFREIERAATRAHVDHMRSGKIEKVRASSLLLDVTRDLKRIEAHLAATAHGLLEDRGQLRTSRLAP